MLFAQKNAKFMCGKLFERVQFIKYEMNWFDIDTEWHRPTTSTNPIEICMIFWFRFRFFFSEYVKDSSGLLKINWAPHSSRRSFNHEYDRKIFRYKTDNYNMFTFSEHPEKHQFSNPLHFISHIYETYTDIQLQFIIIKLPERSNKRFFSGWIKVGICFVESKIENKFLCVCEAGMEEVA